MRKPKTLLGNSMFAWLIALSYLFLYIPIILVIFYSFNNSIIPFIWNGFSLTWYKELFSSNEIRLALKNSILVATASVALSLLLGIVFIYFFGSKKRDEQTFSLMFRPNLMIPEIVIAVYLLSFFIFCMIPLGLPTLIVGHTLIGTGYVIPILTASFRDIDPRLSEASMDLGASQEYTFLKVTLPMLRPAIITAGLLVFIVSLDDFIFAFFCSGNSAQTLSLYIFSMLRSGASPIVNALSTCIFVVSGVIVLLFSYLRVRNKDLVRW